MIVGMKVGVKVRVRAGKSGQISKAIGLGREDGGYSDVLSSKGCGGWYRRLHVMDWLLERRYTPLLILLCSHSIVIHTLIAEK